MLPPVSVWLIVVFLFLLINVYIQWRVRRNEMDFCRMYTSEHQRGASLRIRRTHQHDDIHNISSRVQRQEQWSTHDAHLSIDHVTIMDQMNKPPSYNNDLPPSYEEAMRIATLNSLGETSDPTVIVVPPRPTNTNCI
ncbi:hypothetical protein JTB14_029740 [Gonioctena quinquepunctata]|nr:hypothetical protein JTB14_029740 [Gonioctena quinquepunctata]